MTIDKVKQEVAETERHSELSEWLDEQFEDYKEVFALQDDDFRRKKILEIGAADRRLAALCLKKHLTGNVISLEPALGAQQEGYAAREIATDLLKQLPRDIRDHVDGLTVAATAEETPFKGNSFDLVLGRSVNFESPHQLAKRLKELLRVGKEVRLYPVNDANRAEYESALDEATGEAPLEYAFKTTLDTTIQTDSGPRHVREDVLIVRRK